MATFKCEVVKIDDVIRHPNADSLIICKIGGYDCISSDISPGVERYKKGDYVVYIPEGAVLPEWMLKQMGFWNEEKGIGMLSGKQGNRVKAIKLRGVVSQGVMYPIRIKAESGYPGPILDTRNGVCDAVLGQDVSEFLGITKYEPPVPIHMAGIVGSLFGYTKSYDIDSLQKTPDVFSDGENVVVTEKLHGTLCQIGLIRGLPEDKRGECLELSNDIWAYVTSKGLGKQGLIQKNTDENKDNIYVKVLQDLHKNNVLSRAVQSMEEKSIDRLYIFGEIFGAGVQSGYAYNKSSPTFKVFDVHANGQYLSAPDIFQFLCEVGLERVPVLYHGPYSYDKMVELRDGKSIEGDEKHIREGIVIRSEFEREYRGLPDNRAQVKFVSPDYLLKSTGEEIS